MLMNINSFFWHEIKFRNSASHKCQRPVKLYCKNSIFYSFGKESIQIWLWNFFDLICYMDIKK